MGQCRKYKKFLKVYSPELTAVIGDAADGGEQRVDVHRLGQVLDEAPVGSIARIVVHSVSG